MTDWVSKAGKKKLKEKAQAIVEAVDAALWEKNPRFNAEYRAASAALREAINQTQNGQGMIAAAELHLLAAAIEKLD
jgi:recombinational DNA repair protein (RecF pathway)